ncbi:hypothetical protein LQ327_30030 [Actinomycetospora endophytica]|uniref:STAS domain-containing protein n=1 Tax=Actinomycetospora endophytica TaxID=2291215 RepID=A0ABS8PH82_9PSEU|nr:hypothetical protein [Actinomycetospora endophytica]MCD2197618.1 hypothetical protein [Actinomycetospora endophytica]
MTTRHGALRPARRHEPGLPATCTTSGVGRLTASINALQGPQARRSTLSQALGEATADVNHQVGGTSGPPGAAARGFGGGCVALALGGRFDRQAVDDLDLLLRGLRPLATRHLVVDLNGLGAHHPRLGRVLGRVRIRCLIDGVALDLAHLPPDLAEEFDLPT